MPVSPSVANQSGRWVRSYHLVELLGSGSFGAVYRANTLSCPVAVKLSEHEQMMKDESQILLKLQGTPGVPQWLWFGKDQSHYCLAMSMGFKSLHDLRCLNKTTDYSFSDITIQRILFQITTVLEAIHSKGIVHRDVKPDNILVTFPEGPDNRVSIIVGDFGLALQFKDEDGTLEFPEHAPGVRRLFHSTPNGMMNIDHAPMDDFVMLTYAAIEMTNDCMEQFHGKFQDKFKYKQELLRDPELYMPASLYWLRHFFELVGQQDDLLPVEYEQLRLSLNNSLPNSEASGPLLLTNEDGTWKLY
ncbi:hypothetical protein CAEBREN_08747 [Caenorhabditis brenneri]|uniref:non-specific serine/threonine protein kinase n=1 Tax=Caenorhabditis brenneri TaxID=135651 RepID=G0NKV0_CAEBE|nr:hypothetical protein CAEBREN_08747 [Caenorhabditis brenneri]